MKAKRTTRPPEERFWAKVRIGKQDECWEWLANTQYWGYGRFYVGMVNGKHVETGAHRFAWELTNGQIPKGMNVLHRCDNPPCVNPKHLFLGTFKDNTQDMLAKKRAGCARLPGESNPSAKLTRKQVREIRRRVAKGATQSSLIPDYPVGKSAISFIINGNTWQDA